MDSAQIVILAIVFILVQYVPPRVREQSLDDPAVKKPHLEDIVSGVLLLWLSFIVPFSVFLGFEIRNGLKVVADLSVPYLLGLFESNGM